MLLVSCLWSLIVPTAFGWNSCGEAAQALSEAAFKAKNDRTALAWTNYLNIHGNIQQSAMDKSKNDDRDRETVREAADRAERLTQVFQSVPDHMWGDFLDYVDVEFQDDSSEDWFTLLEFCKDLRRIEGFEILARVFGGI